MSNDKAMKLLLSFEAAEKEMKDLVRDKSEKPEVHQVHAHQPKRDCAIAVEVRITR